MPADPYRSFTDILRRGSVNTFGNIKVATALTLFDSQQQYGDDAKIWENVFVGAGAVASLLNESTVQMSAGSTTSGDSCIRASRMYHRYQPGNGHCVLTTFCLDTAAVSNCRKRVGYFDVSNGIFFEQNGTTDVALTRRTNVSGTPSDTDRTVQANWNLDNLSGTGGSANPSGILADWTKAQHMRIQLQWLGVGMWEVEFLHGDSYIKVHRGRAANVLSTVYMTTANLPVRFEITNVGTAGSIGTMRQICAAVRSSGGAVDVEGKPCIAANGATAISVTTRAPVLSVRAKTTGPNSVRNTGHIHPVHVDVNVGGNSIYYELVLNATLGGTAAVWTDVDATNSLAEFDIASTTITGGRVVASGYIAPGNGTVRGAATESLFRDHPLVYTSLKNTQDQLSLVATSFTGTATVAGAFYLEDQY
jgi:hypothetical protein